jgi:hypothetical protein
VAAYNAGPRAIEAVAYYNQWDKSDFNTSAEIQNFVPSDLIESLFWSGKYNPATQKIDFKGWEGVDRNWSWYKACVVQRHIARVIQHVTLLPEFFVESLEGADGCSKTEVPLRRQTSSGIKP